MTKTTERLSFSLMPVTASDWVYGRAKLCRLAKELWEGWWADGVFWTYDSTS